jgi:hypothetical protein
MKERQAAPSVAPKSQVYEISLPDTGAYWVAISGHGLHQVTKRLPGRQNSGRGFIAYPLFMGQLRQQFADICFHAWSPEMWAKIAAALAWLLPLGRPLSR